MNAPQSSTLDAVKDVIVTALSISERADQIDADTALFGSMPELDSFAVVEIAASLEERFGISIDDDDFTGDVFETVGTLAAFVEGQLAPASGG